MYERWSSRLKNVTWGYRDKFGEALNKLKETGQLDIPEEDPAFKAFDKAYMKLVGKDYCTDHVADVFLQSLYKKLSWIISIPELMESWGNYGLKLLNDKLYYAIRYFELWNKNLDVSDPVEMRFIMSTLHLIEARLDVPSALAFLEGYPLISEALPLEKIHVFVEEGINMFAGKPNMACKFFRLELTSSKKLVELISKRCSLKDISSRLVRLFKSICGIDEFKIEDTSKLDSDELIEKGSTTVCFAGSMYLPARVTVFDNADMNTKWYLAAVYANAFAILFKGFPSVHTMPGFESSQDMLLSSDIKSDAVMQELFYIMDVTRIFLSAFRIFPGARVIIKSIVKTEMKQYLSQERASVYDIILYSLVCTENSDNQGDDKIKAINAFAQYVKELTMDCESFIDIVKLLPVARERFDVLLFESNTKDDANKPAINLSFYSDYSYRTGMDTPPESNKKLLKNENNQNGESDNKKDDEERDSSEPAYSDSKKITGEKKEKESGTAVYMYDEWNNETQDYLYDWCHLSEIKSFYMDKICKTGDVLRKEQVRKVRQVFERLRPDMVKKKKNLLTGDDVVLDSLVKYLVEKKTGLYPEEKIYCKDFKDERDIATALLIDISGSTAENVDGQEVLEIEKSTAFLLAEGLKELGDKFGIFGFSGSGREKCSYYVFKKFEEAWKDEQQQRLIGCRPSSSTRIGVAIRHTAEKLKSVDSKRKLIIVITDGKPQDSDGYTTEGLYAQHDVRMACIEAKRNGIVVFCLSTENNSFEELELMFPVKRYVIMRNINELPQLLAQSYIKLTI
jgi:hypothetical protein